jgi:hypothetical protein
MFRRVVLGIALLAVCLGQGSSWAKGPKKSGAGLWIVADRIVGFVPFTVYVYGKLSGVEPGEVELCRSEVSLLAGSAAAGGGPAADQGQPRGNDPAPCASGKVVRTPEGYDYTHDMRFDRPGSYQVQLVMLDREGHRLVSNSVRVNAL